jgi:hypothetical protein
MTTGAVAGASSAETAGVDALDLVHQPRHRHGGLRRDGTDDELVHRVGSDQKPLPHLGQGPQFRRQQQLVKSVRLRCGAVVTPLVSIVQADSPPCQDHLPGTVGFAATPLPSGPLSDTISAGRSGSPWGSYLAPAETWIIVMRTFVGKNFS